MRHLTNETHNLKLSTQWLAIVAALVLGFAACGDSVQRVSPPEISLTPANIIFDTGQDTDIERNLRIDNLGGSDLVIDSWRLSGSTPEAFDVEGLDRLVVPAGESKIVQVIYFAGAPTHAEATLNISSNTGSGRQAQVRLATVGTGTVLVSTPESVMFYIEELNQSVERSLELNAIGNGEVTISRIELFDAFGEFELSGVPELPIVARQGAELGTLTVTYHSNMPQDITADIEVTCDADNCHDGVMLIPVQVVTRLPSIEVLPIPLQFVAEARNEPVAEEVTIYNHGSADLEVDRLVLRDLGSPQLDDDGPRPSDLRILRVDGAESDGSASFTVAPGAEVSALIEYTPRDPRGLHAELVVESNDPYEPKVRVPIGGAVPDPRLVIIPDEYIDFGTIAIGITGRRTIQIRNEGAAPLEVESISMMGSNSDLFNILNADIFPLRLLPNEDEVLFVEFTTPASAIPNTEYSAVIEIAGHNDPDYLSNEIYLNLYATAGSTPFCQIVVNPPTIDFGLLVRGTEAEGFTTVQNIGSGPCQVNGVSMQGNLFNMIPGFAGDYFRITRTEPAQYISGGTLIPGEMFKVYVKYSPERVSAMGDTLGDTASVLLNITDPNAPNMVNSEPTVRCGHIDFGQIFNPIGFSRPCGINLRGRSGVADIATIPGFYDAGAVTLECNSQREDVLVYSVGTAPVSIDSISFSDECDGHFQLSNIPMLPHEMQPQESFTMQIRYRPTGEFRTTCRIIFEGSMEGGRHLLPLRGTGTRVSSVTEEFTQRSGRDVDVLFVVDNSGSMGDLQNNLQRNIDAFITEARNFDSDFQFAVVTTQSDGRIPDPDGGNRDPGQFLGNLRIFTPTNDPQLTAFRKVVLVGTSNSSESAIERGFESARLALSDPLITDLDEGCSGGCEEPYQCVRSVCGGYNRGFLRRNAALEIIFLSDEAEQSAGTLDFYIDFFKSIKGFRNDSLFAASSIAGPAPDGCQGSNGSADPAPRYVAIAERTGGDFAPICDADFSNTLKQIGQRTFGLQNEFFLSRVADPATVEVRVGGVLRTSGWSYHQSSNSVVWNEADAPAPGTQFTVSYEAACF